MLWRRRLLVAATTAATVAVALVAVVVVTPTYRATVDVVVGPSVAERVVAGDGWPAAEAERQVHHEVALIGSTLVRAAVRAAVRGRPGVSDDVDSAVAEVAIDGSDVVRISVTGSTAQGARRLADVYVRTYVRLRRERDVLQLADAAARAEGEILALGAASEARAAHLRERRDDLRLAARLAADGGPAPLGPAEGPAAPVSPNRPAIVVGAGLLGLLLGAAAAHVADRRAT